MKREFPHFFTRLITIVLVCTCTIFTMYAGESLLSKEKAVDVFSTLETLQRYTETLSPENLNTLPIGIQHTLGNTSVTVAVYKVVYYKDYASIDVFAKIKIPQGDGKELIFGMNDVKLSYNGGIIGDAKLQLLGDVEIPLFSNSGKLTLKGSFSPQTIDNEELTYAKLSCKGITEIGITAAIEFSKSLMTTVNKGVPTGNAVSADFHTVVTDWNDVLVGIDLPDFAVVGLDGFVFSCKNTVFDFSDSRNSESIVFPKDYQSTYLIAGEEQLWRGVYADNIKVSLPKQFTNKDNPDNPVSFEANHLLIDGNGITGAFLANLPLLPYDKGSASGWKFSVDRFNLALEANRITQAGFGGWIGLPLGTNCKLTYNALIDADNQYQLAVNPVDTLSFDVFRAQAILLPNSYVKLVVADKKFVPEACLHGSMGISLKNEKSNKETASFKGITFQSLQLQTVSPYISADYFGYTGKVSLVNLPLSIQQIGLSAHDNEVALHLNLGLKLADIVQAQTSFRIIGERPTEQTGNAWKYKKYELDDIVVDASIAEVISLSGSLTLKENDPTYGNGVGGNIKLSLSKGLPGFEAEASAMFGKTDFSYWYVDAKAVFPAGIPLGAVTLTGFSGGASYAMSKSTGTTLSNTTCKYIPSSNVGLGLKAGVLFAIARKEVVDCDASFEILFNRYGGLNFIGFYGHAKFMGSLPGVSNISDYVSKVQTTAIKKENEYAARYGLDGLLNLKTTDPNKAANELSDSKGKVQAGLNAQIAIEYGFANKNFDANFKVSAYVAKGLIRGCSANNIAGWSALHIDPNKWYLHMGTPTKPIGLTMGISDVITASSKSYFMVGDGIPAAATPPQEVMKILNMSQNSLTSARQLDELSTGRGFAFGSSLGFDTGDLRCLIFYARFNSQVGFDIMMKQYENAYCRGCSGNIGLDGWYAQGQVYAFLQGELGVTGKFIGKRYYFDIINGSAATLLQAQLPNPTWMEGRIGVKYSFIHGAIKGSGHFDLSFGKRCDVITSQTSEVEFKLIKTTTPTTTADVFVVPQVSFSLPIGVAMNESTSQKRVALKEFSVKNSAGVKVSGEIKWNDAKDLLSFYPTEILQPQTKYTAFVNVQYEEYKKSKWQTYYSVKGETMEEKKTFSFTTGNAPQSIPVTNVEYAYPVVDQRNFHCKESNKGFIKLKQAQNDLFGNSQCTADFVQANGAIISMPLQYDATKKLLNFDIPAGLVGSTLYNLQINARAKTTTGQVNTQAKTLLNYAFKTSKYETFDKRIKAITFTQPFVNELSTTMLSLGYNTKNMEGFDAAELVGTDYTGNKPLVKAEATGEDMYYKQEMYPVIYQGYAASPLKMDYRNTTVLGVPPFKAVEVQNPYLSALNNSNEYYLTTVFPYQYTVPQYYYRDFVNIRQQAANTQLAIASSAYAKKILNYEFKLIPAATYKVHMQYVLPNGMVSSQTDMNFKKP